MDNWYEFNQNNSGGSFDVDDEICHVVWIEADSQEAAVQRAEELGIYFNGVAIGIDCPCCGDRWYEPWKHTEFPLNYDGQRVFENVREYAQYTANKYGWTKPDSRLFYKDGNVEEVFTQK